MEARPVVGALDEGEHFRAVPRVGQSRVLLIWTRLIMPNGASIVLERQSGADTGGYAVLQDDSIIAGASKCPGGLSAAITSVHTRQLARTWQRETGPARAGH